MRIFRNARKAAGLIFPPAPHARVSTPCLTGAFLSVMVRHAQGVGS